MQIKITLKTPDAVAYAVADAVEHLPDDESREEAKAAAMVLCARWFKYGEYVTIAVDTDAKTATVLPV